MSPHPPAPCPASGEGEISFHAEREEPDLYLCAGDKSVLACRDDESVLFVAGKGVLLCYNSVDRSGKLTAVVAPPDATW